MSELSFVARRFSSSAVLCRLVPLGVFVVVAVAFSGCTQSGYDSPGKSESDSGRQTASEEGTSGEAEDEQVDPTLKQSVVNLKMIGVALHNYHDQYRSFPPAYTTDSSGQPLLSWRVLLLPYLNEQQLYQQFNLNEPWDSPHNKQLLAKIPDVYRTPGSNAPAGATNYLGVAGPGAIFEGPIGARFADIRDGTSNTLIVVEANDQAAVEWTRPEDIDLTAPSAIEKLVGLRQGHFPALTADGAVHPISGDITPQQLQAMATKSGGEVIAWQLITYGK